MVATAKQYRQGPGPGPVAAQQVDVAHVKERRGGAADGGAGAGNAAGYAAAGLNEPLGGFIFVCNNDTMPEDLERQLFGTFSFFSFSLPPSWPGLSIGVWIAVLESPLRLHATVAFEAIWKGWEGRSDNAAFVLLPLSP